MVISVKRELTNDYGLLREKMLKSEALLTLSLKASFEAHSAPTLHGKSNEGAPVFCVGALVINSDTPFRSKNAVPSRAASLSAPVGVNVGQQQRVVKCFGNRASITRRRS